MANTFEDSRASLNVKPGGALSNRVDNNRPVISQRSNDGKDGIKDQDNSGLAIKKYNQEVTELGHVISVNQGIGIQENTNPQANGGMRKSMIKSGGSPNDGNLRNSQILSAIESSDGPFTTPKPLIDNKVSQFAGVPPPLSKNYAEMKTLLSTAIQPGTTFRGQLIESDGSYRFVG